MAVASFKLEPYETTVKRWRFSAVFRRNNLSPLSHDYVMSFPHAVALTDDYVN